MMADTIHSSAFVHPTAVVDDGAILHEGVKVWHFCHVMPLAMVGSVKFGPKHLCRIGSENWGKGQNSKQRQPVSRCRTRG